MGKFRVFAFLAVIVLLSCGRGSQQQGQPGPVAPPAPTAQKIDPPAKSLIVQAGNAPSETDFANTMTVAVDDSTSGRYSFDYLAQHDGLLTLDWSKNFRVEAQDCQKDPERSYTFDLIWSLVQDDGSLQKLAGFTIYSNDYPYSAGRHYRLTFTILGMSQTFADCHSVRVRFAIQEKKAE